MGRLLGICVSAALLLAACSSPAVGPELPRPDGVSTTLAGALPSTTTTTVDPRLVMATTCPTVFCLVYHVAREATWSDGTAVTAEDFAYTAEVNRVLDDAVRPPGYDLISGVDVIDDKTVRVSLTDRFGSWQGLFARVLPSSYESLDVVTMPKTGPFDVAAWVEGDRMVLGRNNAWWAESDPISGTPVGTVDELTVRFIDELTESVSALEDGEVDVVTARPDEEAVARLGDLDGVVMRVTPGPFWEHIDFHHADNLLQERWLREAIAMAVDREAILDATVRLLQPDALPLDNTMYMRGTQFYEDHYSVDHDPDGAERLLTNHGCVRGEDEVFSCAGRRLSLIWASTSDDPAREAIFTEVRDDLAAIGIELAPEFRSPSAFVNRDFLFGGPGVWSMIDFSWRASEDPGAAAATYYCGDTEMNVNRYCSDEVDTLVRAANEIVDPERRATTLNEADRRYLADLALIPLYQKPNLLAWRTPLIGPQPNYTTSTDLWNVGAWRGPDSLTLALPSEPLALDPLSYEDESANTVMSALLYGAFGLTPSHEYVPVLVESVDLLEG